MGDSSENGDAVRVRARVRPFQPEFRDTQREDYGVVQLRNLSSPIKTRPDLLAKAGLAFAGQHTRKPCQRQRSPRKVPSLTVPALEAAKLKAPEYVRAPRCKGYTLVVSVMPSGGGVNRPLPRGPAYNHCGLHEVRTFFCPTDSGQSQRFRQPVYAEVLQRTSGGLHEVCNFPGFFSRVNESGAAARPDRGK